MDLFNTSQLFNKAPIRFKGLKELYAAGKLSVINQLVDKDTVLDEDTLEADRARHTKKYFELKAKWIKARDEEKRLALQMSAMKDERNLLRQRRYQLELSRWLWSNFKKHKGEKND